MLRFDSLREDIRGATVAFRHDVLRDWAVGFLLHEDEELLNALPLDKSLPPGLARGLEIAARLAIESDATGARWLVLLAAVLWHVLTWFQILPKTMPKLILRGRQLPPRQLTAIALLVAVICSAGLLVIVVTMGARS